VKMKDVVFWAFVLMATITVFVSMATPPAQAQRKPRNCYEVDLVISGMSTGSGFSARDFSPRVNGVICEREPQ